MRDGGLVRALSVGSPVRGSDALETPHTREDTHGLNQQKKDHDGKAQP
jgi:hypothetical protein